MPKYTAKKEVAVEQSEGLEVKEIESIADYDGRWNHADREAYIANVIIPKYPKYQISIVHQEDARQTFMGWFPLAIDYTKGEVSVVKKFEDAEQWKSKSVLCWRDKRIQDMKDADLRKRQEQNNRFLTLEDTKSQALALNQEAAREGIRFSPIPDA